MFRHPYLKYRPEPIDRFNEDIQIDHFIRYYTVPSIQDKQDVLNLLQKKVGTLTVKKSSQTKLLRTVFTIGYITSAACLILFLLYFNNASYNCTLSSDPNCSFFLPDKSRVILENGSSINYSSLFILRRVNLDGYAYFEVKKGKKFKVITPNGEVSVLGTRFSVVETIGGLQVCCYDGSVSLKYGKEVRQLFSGQMAVASNHKISSSVQISDKYPELAYFNKKYQNASLPDICNDLENFFGYKINPQVNEDYRFSGSFHVTDIQTALDILCTPFNLSNENNIDQSFSILPFSKTD